MVVIRLTLIFFNPRQDLFGNVGGNYNSVWETTIGILLPFSRTPSKLSQSCSWIIQDANRCWVTGWSSCLALDSHCLRRALRRNRWPASCSCCSFGLKLKHYLGSSSKSTTESSIPFHMRAPLFVWCLCIFHELSHYLGTALHQNHTKAARLEVVAILESLYITPFMFSISLLALILVHLFF